jgi:hypothetical protein
LLCHHHFISSKNECHIGEYQDGKENGAGKYYFKSNGDVMQGEWVDGICHHGKIYFESEVDPRAVYEGVIENSKLSS